MTEARGSERRGLDTGEARERRSDAPVDLAMKMTTAATATTAETAGVAVSGPMEKHENGKWRSKSEALATLSNWRSRMERTMRQQAQELTQLHRTVGHLPNLVQAQAAREEAQWLAMLTRKQEREQKWDSRHEDNKLWGAVSTNMIPKIMKGVAPRQKVREKVRDKIAKMDSEGLEASQHADTTQEGGPETHQQLQQQPKPKLLLKLQPKLQHVPKLKLAPAVARRWETVPPPAQSHMAPIGPGPGPGRGPTATTGSRMAERRLIFRRDDWVPPPNKMN